MMKQLTKRVSVVLFFVLFLVTVVVILCDESRRDECRETYEKMPCYVPRPLRQTLSDRARFFWTQSTWSKMPYALSNRMIFTKWRDIEDRVDKTYRKMKQPEAILGMYTGGALVAYILQHVILTRHGVSVPVHVITVRSKPMPNNCVERHANGQSKYFDSQSIATVQNLVHDKSVMLVDDSIFKGTTLQICTGLFPSIEQIMIFSKIPFVHSSVNGLKVHACSSLAYIPFDIAPVTADDVVCVNEKLEAQ